MFRARFRPLNKQFLTAVALLLIPVSYLHADEGPILFGYAAIACDHDDPHDDAAKTDYIDEVAGWTTTNQVCITADRTALIDRLQRAAAAFTPVFFIEPVFFERRGGQLVRNPQAVLLWGYTRDAINDSGMPPEELIFYVVDEPAHFGLPRADVEFAIGVIEATFPGARTLVIEAYRPEARPDIPINVTFWGFNSYAIVDPARDAGYRQHLDLVRAALRPDQRLALVLDAVHTPFHTGQGIGPEDMGAVALNYEALARSVPEVGLVLGYTWPGGIDGLWEQGVRNLPPEVRDTHREIGLRLRN